MLRGSARRLQPDGWRRRRARRAPVQRGREERVAAHDARKPASALLGRTGPLIELNCELCTRIAEGTIALTDERLIRHLWATTMEKLAVDQPSYAAFREEQLRS